MTGPMLTIPPGLEGEVVSRWDMGPSGELVMMVTDGPFMAEVHVYLVQGRQWSGPILEAEV